MGRKRSRGEKSPTPGSQGEPKSQLPGSAAMPGAVPERAALLAYVLEKAYKPLTLAELARIFNLDKGLQRELTKLLTAMEADGDIVQTRTKRYGAPERMNLVVGRLQAHHRGFGFVIPVRSGAEDLFISAANMGTAMHDDRVVARIVSKGSPPRQRAEGEIIRILNRANEEIVGVLDRTRRYGFVTPSDTRLGPDIFIPLAELNDARSGEVVVVAIARWPEGRRAAEGRVIKRLGRHDEPGVDMAIIMVKYGLDRDFPKAVKHEASRIESSLAKDDYVGRRDLRDLLTVTIDGADARDLDDAVSLTALSDQGRSRWRLGVHIADVSHYVPAGSILDQEARHRGTSAYLVDRVIPMLPPELSNGICSLDARVDRLALSLLVDLDDEARVVGHELVPSVIRVDRRLSYDEVYGQLQALPADPSAAGQEQDADPVASMLATMHRLAQSRFKARLGRGSIDFDFPEAKIVLDDRGQPVDIEVVRRNAATQLIEEFMLLSNEIIAERFNKMKVPFLYRVHEPPTAEAVTALQNLLALFNHRVTGIRADKAKPRDFQRMLALVEDRPEQYLMQVAALRSLQRARYGAENLGHFGLASTFYTHFTAPIRRYPDLLIHRIIKLLLADQLDAGKREAFVRLLPEVAADASAAERHAEEAERESRDLKKAQYMAQYVDEEFDGFIAGVVPFGLFVQLPNTVEGLVHVSTMADDYYQYKETHHMLLGERTGKAYQPGDAIRIKVAGVDLAKRTVDFVLVQ